MNASDITLKQMQQMVHEWITTVGVRYFSPLTNMAILAEETGEVARIMARRHGDQSWKHGENPDLADELAGFSRRSRFMSWCGRSGRILPWRIRGVPNSPTCFGC